MNPSVGIPGAAGPQNSRPLQRLGLADGLGKPARRQRFITNVKNSRCLVCALDELAHLRKPPTFIMNHSGVTEPYEQKRTHLDLLKEIARALIPNTTRFRR